MSFVRPLLIPFFLLWMIPASQGQPESKPAKKTIFDLLYQDEDSARPKLLLELELDELLSEDLVETPARVAFTTREGVSEAWNIKLEIRGRFRRRECDIPPLKLNFVKGELKDRGLKKDDQLKLVTHCKDIEEARENVLREWLVYQLYRELTDFSLRAQLMEVEYRDVNSDQSLSNLGFVIESIEQLAKRLDKKECEDCMGLTVDNYDQKSLLRMAVFQYMIGNTDWSGHLVRNMKALGDEGSLDNLLPIPYDFDFSYLVNTDYAKFRAELGQEKLKDRVYLGPPVDPKACEEVLAEFSAKREAFYGRVEGCDELSDEAKKEMTKYLDSFFKDLDKGRLAREISEAPLMQSRF